MINILLLLANGFEAYEAAVFTDVFGFARTGGAEIELTSIGLTSPLQCAYGFKAIPDRIWPNIDLELFDALAVPGGRREAGYYDDCCSSDFQTIIKHFAKTKKPIATVCVGALPVAQTGILKGKKATTYPGKKQTELEGLGATIIDEPIVIDENIITSQSPLAGLEVAFTLLGMLTSEEIVNRTKSAFGLIR